MESLFNISGAYFCSAQHEPGSFSLKRQLLRRSDSSKGKGHFQIRTYLCFHTFDKLVEAENLAIFHTEAGAKRIRLVSASKRIPDGPRWKTNADD